MFLAVLLVAGLRSPAQAPAGGAGTGPGAGSAQNKPSQDAQKPADAQPQSTPPSGSNAFPEDTSNVPVMPSKGTAALPEGTYTGDDAARTALPGEDLDPARSPDDPAPDANSGQDSQSSSSLADMDKLLPGSDDEQTSKKRKMSVKEPSVQESASSDVDVGNYYLQTKNWRAALSRFQSAMVLDPDNPEVFWGLAEAERRLGNFADARSHYQKVVDYDPDSRHGKDARKALKDPEIANAQNAAHGPSTPQPPK
jgi:tetratricopeptide (TPR) repeat protein